MRSQTAALIFAAARAETPPEPGVGTGGVLAYTNFGEALAPGDARCIEPIPSFPVENVAIAPISGGVTIRGLKLKVIAPTPALESGAWLP